MPRLRRKTPHEPVRAIPSPAERGPGALPRAPRPAALTLREIAISLNGGAPRPKVFDLDLPAYEELAPPETVAPFRGRVEAREGRAELLVFRLGAELFATELRAVEEAVEGADARALPDAGPSMLGIFPLRDRTLPMYALARVLGLSSPEARALTLVMLSTTQLVSVVSGAVVSICQVWPTGEASTLPAASRARTLKVCSPSASGSMRTPEAQLP